MTVLVLAAGYLYFIGAHATSVIPPLRPPIEVIAVHYVTTAKNSDGSAPNKMFCFNNLVASIYGPYTYCYAGRKNGTVFQARFGNWNAVANGFFPASAWMNQL